MAADQSEDEEEEDEEEEEDFCLFAGGASFSSWDSSTPLLNIQLQQHDTLSRTEYIKHSTNAHLVTQNIHFLAVLFAPGSQFFVVLVPFCTLSTEVGLSL
jgi:hypothetical protein